MPDRVVLHADCNNFFASCECLERPELRDVPMAVAGDPEMRTGVVVAKNELAKKCGVKTTDTVFMARQKCPGIVFVPPRHDFYRKISRRVNAIYAEYTEYVEPASIDESYLDVTEALPFFGLSGRGLVDEVACNLRRHKLKGEVVFIQIRRPDMSVLSRQKTLDHFTCLQHEIQQVAFALVEENWPIGPAQPIRALTVGVTKLAPAAEVTEQLSLFDLSGGSANRERQERLEAAVDALRRKHGDGAITLGYPDNAEIGIKRDNA